jgi:ketosteroid isomerase-like protein
MAEPLDPTEVMDAAEALVTAFRATQTEQYFDSFAPDATFVFSTDGRTRLDRDQYRREWESWVAAGWQVVDCRSDEQQVQVLGEVAVFTHRVATTTRVGHSDLDATLERETIVFVRGPAGRLLAAHEHLSEAPEGA